ncbi:MAG: restriction endonuclease subunit S [Paludibacter sp.]|nr:restriction endonuclease subunit S [Paludibacter sp.]
MAQYNLSGNIDPNKVFLINRSELEGRFDSTSYKPSFCFSSSKYKMEKLKKVAYLNPKVSFEKLDREKEISFVPMEVINEHNGKISETRFKKVEESKGFTRFAENDLIWAKITPCMQNGKSAVARNLQQGVGCGSTEFFVIRPKSETELLVDYLHFLLRDARVLKDAQNYFGGSAGQQRVSPEFIKDFKVPMLPIEMQQIIVDIIGNAYITKQQKDAEAKALLESIDSYLLEELGITLPEKSEVKAEDIPTWMNPENLLVKNGRLFLTNSREVIGQRFDPKPYDTNTKNLKQAIANCKTNSVQLKSLIIHSCAGDWGTDETEAEENQENKKCLVIRATEFDNKYNLNLDNTRVKYRLIKQSKLTRMDIQENDLLIEKSGGSPDQPVGRIAFLSKEILNNDTHISYSNFIHKIRVNSTKINPQYLFYFLKTMHNVKLTETMQSQTNGIRNLIMYSYFAQNIPLPEKDKQEAIIRNISLLLTKAQNLENEAIQILKQAKIEIEQMILGE